ncbi:unnamed protein product [Blepharisma stoltei]|uniref:Uncharacterized protein n=1 Tax=Blepharisma stoltei TaxID=1481888 RepID=A0AAU9JAV6_9CILI|nr:unnamed protein product [Blepharisma stoltei]
MSKLGYVTGGYTPLMIAAEEGNLERVKQFLPKSQINQKNESGYTALALAAKSGHLAVAKELIKNGADVNARNNSGQTILFIAAWHNQIEVIKELLNFNADIDAYDQRGWTPLMIAVYHSYPATIQFLLEHGADPKHKDSFGKDCISRCKDEKIKAILAPEPVEEKSVKSRKSPVRTKAGVSPQRSRDPTPKRVTTPQKSRETTPKRDVHPAAIYQSLNLDSEPEDRVSKFKDELERHIKASTTTLACRSAENCLNRIKRTINSEIVKAYELMHTQIHNKLAQNLQQLYENMGSKLVQALDTQCEQGGMAIPQASYNQPPLQISFQAKRGLPKLQSLEQPKVYDRLNKMPYAVNKDQLRRSFSSEDLQSEMYSQIDREIERLSQKLDTISSQEIQEEVKHKVDQLSRHLLHEIEANMAHATSKIYIELQKVVEERFQQIHEFNSANQVNESNQEIKNVMTPPGRMMPKLKLDSLQDSRKSENYDYIQNIASSYKDMKK